MFAQQKLFRALQCLAIAMLLSLPSFCSDNSVLIRVLDGTDAASPITHELVIVHLLYGKEAKAERLETDSKGEVRLELPAQKPDAIDIQVKFDSPDLRCSCRAVAKTDTILQEGVLKLARGLEPKAALVPGEVVFIAGPSSTLHKVFYTVAGR